MKGMIAALILFWGLSSWAGEVHVEIAGLKTGKSVLFWALHNSPDTYLNESVDPYAFEQVKIQGDSSHDLILEGVPSGDYALIIFQDMNSNGKLDTNFLGIPSEPIGFSNNPAILFGPPKYEELLFRVKEGRVSELKVQMKFR